MIRALLPVAMALLLGGVPNLRAQSPPQSAHDLVKDVVFNELQERLTVSLWQYRAEKRVGSQTSVEQEIETVSGRVYRVLARQGRPLDQADQEKETERLNSLLRNSAEQARIDEEFQADEQRLQRLIAVMPEAFVYAYDGTADGNLRLSFRPNPAYNPATYEARIFHALTGGIWIQPQQKRLLKIDARIFAEVDFGFGLLGRIDKGGTFQIERQQVDRSRWKTSLVDVHVSGRMVLFKTISKDQHVVRSDFRPVPSNLTVQEAIAMLNAMSP